MTAPGDHGHGREEFAERWAATRVDVTSPNGMVHVSLHGDERVEVRLQPGYVERTPVWQFCEQVGRAARLTFAARTQAFFGLRSEQAGRLVRPSRRPANARAAAYLEAMSRLTVQGRSADGAATVAAVGMSQFLVTTDPAAHGRMGGGGMGRALSEAATGVLRDQLVQGREVRARIYEDLPVEAAVDVPAPASRRPAPRRTTSARSVPSSWLEVGWRPAAG